MEYNISVEESLIGTKIEITSESDIEYVINVINKTLTVPQINALVKKTVEIVEEVFLSCKSDSD